MEYQEVIRRLEEMESRYNDGFSFTDRDFLENIHYTLFGKVITNKGCGDCYRDAYMLIKIKLKRDKSMPKEPDYKLKAGAIIQFFGESKVYTNSSLTNEVAERYISLNPNNIAMFAKYPEDYNDRVAAYVANEISDNDEEPSSEALLRELSELRENADNLGNANIELAEKLRLAEEEIEQLKNASVQTDNSETIANLEKQIADLKSENRALKAANTRMKNKSSKDSDEDDKSDVTSEDVKEEDETTVAFEE